MRQHVATGVLGCLLAVTSLPSNAISQEAAQPNQTVEFKGTAKLSAHTYRLLKGATYRVTVQADGFVPELAVVDDLGVLTGAAGDLAGAAQLVFTSPETRDYRFLVTFSALKLKKGENRYVLTIEKASFATETSFKDPLKLNEHTRTLTANRLYNIAVTSYDFEPDIRILDGDKTVASRNSVGSDGFAPYDFKPDVKPPLKPPLKREYVTNLSFAPPRTAQYRILVSVGRNSKLGDRALAYITRVTELKPELSIVGEIKNDDPVYRRWGEARHKVHALRLEAGATYQIDLASDAFDAFLFLEDASGDVILADDDSGGNLNARIVVRPKRSETHRIIATTFDRDGFATGPYTLTVVVNPHARPSAPHSVPVPGEPLGKKK
ncbi:MAG: hypothetical protein L0Y71_14515 [Gemmataceae bacterium]|nr:hypothetical protein [Gemmataceae bacterium]